MVQEYTIEDAVYICGLTSISCSSGTTTVGGLFRRARLQANANGAADSLVFSLVHRTDPQEAGATCERSEL